MGEPVEVLSALCNGLIRTEPLPSRFVGLFVQTVSMVTTGHATGLEKTLLHHVNIYVLCENVYVYSKSLTLVFGQLMNVNSL